MPKMKEKQQLEEFEMIFVDMGQGDCCIIRCPDGNVIMVDCGSSGNLDLKGYTAAKQQLLAWANGGGIYAIILTHPDRDHYNMTENILSKVNPLSSKTEYLKVDHVIFSTAYSEKSPMGNYNQNGICSLICDGYLGNPQLYEITMNDTNSYYLQWEQKNSNYQKYTKEDIIGFNVIKGTTVSGKKKWSIDILAGNVLRDKSGPLNTNAASLVTLLRIGDEKILLTGDSTVETQDFLYKTYKKSDTIKNLTIFQVPHHGSEECLSKSSFINLVNPEQLVVSVGIINDSYCLPRYKVLEAWINANRLAGLDVKEGVVTDYWKDDFEAAADYNSFKNFNEILALWTKKGYKYLQNSSNTFYWLKNPSDARLKGSTGFYGFKNTSFYIYREQAQKQIWQTGVMGNIKSLI